MDLGIEKKRTLFYLILIVALSSSCAENKSLEKEINKPEMVITSITDTLQFISGIRVIFQDSKNNYWFGSHKEGVCRFDGKSFQYFTTNEGLSHNQIHSIQEDKNGVIWFGTQNGVNSFDGITFKNHMASVNETSQSQWKKADTDLWFHAGNKEGVYKYDGQKLTYLAFPNPKVINPSNYYAVTSISKGKNDMLWMATYAGVFGYNGQDFTIINDETLGLDLQKEPLHVRSIFEDSKGRLWIGNNGIGVLLKEDEVIINFSEKHKLIHPLSSRKGDMSMPGTLEHVFIIQEDSAGNIWFGDRDTGAWKFDGKTMTNYTINDKLSTSMIWSIYEDNNSDLLFGIADGGVYKFNGKSFDRRF